MNLIKKIYKSSIFVLIPLALLSALIEWKKLPVSILIGGTLGLVNIRGLVWGIEGIFGATNLRGPMVLFTLFRLFLLFVIIIILLYLRLVNILGLMAGFTVVFTILMIEGLRSAKSPVGKQ
ncbi:MAG: hypothetical protein AB1632_05220 [Nitrospirota bacterium]